MAKYTLYDGMLKPRTIEAENIVKARAYVIRWTKGSIPSFDSILIVQGINGKALGEIRGSENGGLRWCPRTITYRGHEGYKYEYHLNKDGTLGKKLGRL